MTTPCPSSSGSGSNQLKPQMEAHHSKRNFTTPSVRPSVLGDKSLKLREAGIERECLCHHLISSKSHNFKWDKPQPVSDLVHSQPRSGRHYIH